MNTVFVMLLILMIIQVVVMRSLYIASKNMDRLQSDMCDLIDQERKQRQQCDNNIMLKLHERYNALVRWMDRMSKANRNTNNKKQDNEKERREQGRTESHNRRNGRQA